MKISYANIKFALHAVAAVTLACTANAVLAQAKPFEGVTLRVGTYGGAWGDAVRNLAGKQVEAMGAKVEYVVGTPSENFAKIVAARGRSVPIDVIELGAAERVAMSRNGFLEDLPTAKIPNLANLSVQIVDQQAIAHVIVQNGIVLRRDVFDAEKFATPTRFEDLQNPNLANRTAFPDVTNVQHWPVITSLAVMNGGHEGVPEKGFEQAMRINPLYYYAAATDLVQKITMGDVIAAPAHAGVAVRLHGAGQAVEFVHPQIGDKRGSLEFNFLGIVKGTKNMDAAAAFINAFLEVQAQAEFSKLMGTVPSNRAARAVLQQDAVMSRFMLLSDAELENTFVMNWDKVDVETWRSTWARTVTR